jgi:hypothetical protein
MNMGDEKVLKAVDELFMVLAETQSKQPGLDRVEQIYDRAVLVIMQHPIKRVISVCRPHIEAEKG